jgi:hypothetical protein
MRDKNIKLKKTKKIETTFIQSLKRIKILKQIPTTFIQLLRIEKYIYIYNAKTKTLC